MTHHKTRTRAEERIAELDATPAALSAQVEELRQQLELTQQEAAEAKANWQRTAADYANFKRRTEQDREHMMLLANEVLLAKTLPIVDDLDRAIANMPAELINLGWVEGIVAIDRKFDLLLASEGLTPIEAVGSQFDPREHEAVVQEERADVADGTVIAELQRGYRMRDRVLRPAMVVVANNPAGGAGGSTHDTPNDSYTRDSGGIN